MRFLTTFWSAIRLIRILNCLIASAGVLVGGYLTGQPWLTLHTTLAALAVFSVCAGGNALNDFQDIESDRINHPDRILVRGRLSLRFAAFLAGASFAVGLALAGLVNLPVILIGTAGTLLTVWYDMNLKRIPAVGNLAVATSAGLTFLIGGAAASPTTWHTLPGPLIPAIFAFLFHFVREIVKDIQDLDGDRRAGIATLPEVLGTRTSLILATAVMIGLLALTCIPYSHGWFGAAYLIIGVGLAEMPSLVLLGALIASPQRRLLAGATVWLKIGMLLGLLALLAG